MFDATKLVKTIPNFLTPIECKIVLECHKDEYYMDHGALDEGSRSSFNFFNNKDANEFLQTLNTRLDFSKRLLEHMQFPAIISNVWLNKQTANSFLYPHIHYNCVLSGSLYVAVDENSSNIKFFHLSEFEVPAKLGSLLIFPSNLRHSGSSKNLSTERIVLSFNIQKLRE